MPELPACLNRRYKVLDELIEELRNEARASKDFESSCNCDGGSKVEPGIKLMCDFWNILKDDPTCNLQKEIQHRLVSNSEDSVSNFPQQIICYRAGRQDDESARIPEHSSSYLLEHAVGRHKKPCAHGKTSGCTEEPCCSSEGTPLSKVLCDVNDAAIHDKKCRIKVNDLMHKQKTLQDQVTELEQREKDGAALLKQADGIWSCMEDTYKKKLAESKERQRNLNEELKIIEKSQRKWQQNKKELESQLADIDKCHREINGKINEKKNDVKAMDVEIADITKRLEANKKELANISNVLSTKKQNSEAKCTGLAKEFKKLEGDIDRERNIRASKEYKGNKYVNEARNDLQKLCKILLQKKIENEDLKAEKLALMSEINLLKVCCEDCSEKYQLREEAIDEEIVKLKEHIATYKCQCRKCHAGTDVQDIRALCTDCPRCLKERNCIETGDQCNYDTSLECVCMKVKEKFLENVFENMYIILEKRIKTSQGKAVGDKVINCLKKSRNGKLDAGTRRTLQEFILAMVKKNLNFTIVGGAVKTRCEMEPETYQELLKCLKDVTVPKAEKTDKSVPTRKDPCKRWGAESECNCPSGNKDCPCTKHALPKIEHSSCPVHRNQAEDKDDDEDEIVAICAQNESCRVENSKMLPSESHEKATKMLTSLVPEPCKDSTCNTFSKNMRAAQCVFSPESLASVTKPGLNAPISPYKINKCPCDSSSNSTCKGPNPVKASIVKSSENTTNFERLCNQQRRYPQQRTDKSTNKKLSKSLRSLAISYKDIKDDSNKNDRIPPTDIYTVKIKGLNNDLSEIPGVLQKTHSNNFNFVFDKEYEKIYHHEIKEHLGDSCIGGIKLIKTSPDHYDIYLEDNDEYVNAMLVTNGPGDIKVITTGPDFDYLMRASSNHSDMQKSSCNTFKDLLTRMSLSDNDKLKLEKYFKSDRFASKEQLSSDNCDCTIEAKVIKHHSCPESCRKMRRQKLSKNDCACQKNSCYSNKYCQDSNLNECSIEDFQNVIEPPCPLHEKISYSISKERCEQCHKGQKQSPCKAIKSWDSIMCLPPQLPTFLRDDYLCNA